MLAKSILGLTIATATVLTGVVYAGPDWIEGDHGEAGSLPNTSQTTVGTALQKISGKLTTGAQTGFQIGSDLQDMYLIRIDDPLHFCATTVPSPNLVGGGAAEFDTKLWLFDATGHGVLGNDDTAVSFLESSTVSGSTIGPFACDETQSSIPGPGLYYIAISRNHVPFSDSGPIFNFDDANTCGPGELSGPDGSGAGDPISGWSDNIVDFNLEVEGGGAGDFARQFTLAGNPSMNPQVFTNIGDLDDPSEFNDWKIGWNFGSDNDPTEGQASLGSGFTIENLMPDVADPAANHLKFTITIQMKLKIPTIPSILGGNAAITLLTRPSAASNAGRLATAEGPVWNALINGADSASLFAPSFVLTSPATPFAGSTAVTTATLATFMYTDNVDRVGVRLHFDLSPGEKATFIGVFALLPVSPMSPDDGTTETYTIFLCGASPAQQFITLPLDIRPGTCPNPFNPGSNGVLPVSLLGTSTFNVHDVDLGTVRISRADGVGGEVAPTEQPNGPHSTFGDLGTPFTGELCNCHALHGDGITDLNMKFPSAAMTEVLELTPDDESIELKVTGKLNNGVHFQAHDCINVLQNNLSLVKNLLTVRCNVADTWIDVDPADRYMDEGGFGNFERRYRAGTKVHLTAPAMSHGQMLAGWKIDGKALISSASVSLKIDSEPHTCKAVYVPVVSGTP